MARKGKKLTPENRERVIKNLTPFKKGQSGNPGGRPKRQPITEAYREIADHIFKGNVNDLKIPEGATFAQAAAWTQFIQAIVKRDTRAINEIADRLEGKPNQRVELSGADDAPPVRIAEGLDLSKLNKEQLLQYRAIISAASGRQS